MANKNQIRERERYDIPGLCKAIDERAIEMEPSEYSGEKMAIYGANVNLRRQIREIKDGNKPGARRILMTLYENGLYKGKTSKSLQVIGDVAKHYHPHGDSSIYSTMVYMGQKWRNNIVYIDAKGNFGTAYDSDGYAHQRYTECTMSDFAYDCYFEEWDLTSAKNDMTVDWVPNYDDSGLEPMYLPSKYPVFLLTWDRSMGIGRYCGLVGFNINDAFNAVIKLIKNPEANFLMYPDDPEGCDLVNGSDMKGILDSTDLTVKMRAKYNVNHYDGKDVIEITSTPYEVDPKTVKEAIRTLADKGQLPEISDIDGCSTNFGEGFRLSIELRKGYDPDSVMTKLYKKTQLENTYVMKYAFVNGLQSVDYTLRIAILEWIRCRRMTLRRIHKIKLINVIKRIHFLEPLIRVIESGQIDEFIKIVRTNKEDDAIKKIITGWKLTDYQAEKIINVRISDLSQDKLPGYKSELKKLKEQEIELSELVNDHSHIDEIIIRQMGEGIKKYGGPRKSNILQLIDSIKIPDTIHYLIFTNKYIKKLPYDEKGYRIGHLDTNEKVLKVLVVNNRDTILIFTSDGRCSPVSVDAIGNSNVQSIGISYTQCGTKDNGFVDAINITEENLDKKYLVTTTGNGLISKTSCSELEDKVKPFMIMKLDKEDRLSGVCISEEDSHIMVYTKDGKASVFSFDAFETTMINTKGVQSAKLPDGDSVIGVLAIKLGDDAIVILTDRGYVKKIKISNMPTTKRNGKVIEISSGSGQLISVVSVTNLNENPLFICTTAGVFQLDHMNIKATNRIGKPERAAEMKITDYAFEILHK